MAFEDLQQSKTVDDERVVMPGWVVTFADLMALLVCFFVLLLSFSSMDVEKYKRIAESMRAALGVQGVPGPSRIESIAPGEPVQQLPDPSATPASMSCPSPAPTASAAQIDAERDIAQQQAVVAKVADLVGRTERDAIKLAAALSKEIAAGVLEVETNGRKIILRVKERGSFPSGSASLSSDFKPVLKIIRGVLKGTEGQIYVEGHTDDVPITTAQFRSNWALSSARAISVAHGLFEDGALDQRRFTVTGYADARPLVPNDSSEGRTRNRRVEVVIQQGLEGDVKNDLDALRNADPAGYERVRTELMQRFNLRSDEVF